MLHLNSYHAIWGLISCTAIHMKLLKPSKATGHYTYQKVKSMRKTVWQIHNSCLFWNQSSPQKFLFNHPKVAQLFTNQTVFTIATSLPRLPKLSTHFQQSVCVVTQATFQGGFYLYRTGGSEKK